jgi:hypothetical protein
MREVVAVAEEPAEHSGRARRRHPEHEYSAQADEVEEDRLPVASVAGVSGVLGHVGVGDDAVGRWVPEAHHFVGLDVAERAPATGGAWNVLVYRAVDVGDERAAHEARCQRGRKGVHPSRVYG